MAFVLISEFECFSQDLTETLLILLSSLYLPALCITVSRDREQPAAPVRADNWSAPYNVSPTSSADSFLFRSLVLCSSCKSVMMRTQGCSIPFFKLRNNLSSLTECAFGWCHRTCLSPKYAKNLHQLRKFARSVKKLTEFAWFCHKFSNCRIAKSWRDCLIQLSAL